MEFARYAAAPNNVAKEIISKNSDVVIVCKHTEVKKDGKRGHLSVRSPT